MPLTLVAATLAVKGHRFTYTGLDKVEECACPVAKLCFGLEAGRRYEVTAVRPARHPCGLHEGGKAQVVEVKEVPFPATLERKHLRGTAAPWTWLDCKRPSCRNWTLCHPVGPIEGARHAILAQGGKVECPVGLDLERVSLRKMDEPKA